MNAVEIIFEIYENFLKLDQLREGLVRMDANLQTNIQQHFTAKWVLCIHGCAMYVGAQLG